MEECKGTVPLGKGWRNKYIMVTRSDVSEKTKGENGKLCWDKMVKDLCNPKMFGLYLTYDEYQCKVFKQRNDIIFLFYVGEVSYLLEDCVEARRQFRQLFKWPR